MRLLGVDFETTGLDLQNDYIIEVGAVLWDTEKKTPVHLYSSLIQREEVKELKPEIIELTGITMDMIHLVGEYAGKVFDTLLGLIELADYCVAHNAKAFDKPMFDNQLKRNFKPIPEKYWLDTRTDVPYPKNITTRNLKYLLADHGIINPFSHRALTDAMCMMTLLSKYDINEVIEISKTPTLLVRALVSYEFRQMAKDQSYHWNQKTQMWTKNLKSNQLESEIARCEFEVVVLGEV